MPSRYVASLPANSPRAALWRKVLGTDVLPIESPAPHQANAPGLQAGWFFKLDVAALTSDQRKRLIAHLATQFDIAPEEIARDIDGPHGVPILADGLMISEVTAPPGELPC